MVSKWTFIKPELTFMHINNITTLLEEHYFHLQLLPVVEMLRLYSKTVLEDKGIEEVFLLKRARLLMNLGMQTEGTALKATWDNEHYKLSDEERKLQFEKIKGLREPEVMEGNDKLQKVIFRFEDEYDPVVIESIRIHEMWLMYADELLKWGHYIEAKELTLESNLHCRILKD
jgi:hypothetical protein